MELFLRAAKQIAAATLLVLLLAAPVSYKGVQQAEALSLTDLISGATGEKVTIVSDTSTVGITNTLKNTLSEISTAVSAGADAFSKLKEMTLDGLAWSVAQNVLNQVTADMINWVNGGFNGEPAFVTDLEGFLLDIADDVAGNYIFGTELDRLCEPIRFSVKSAIYTQYVNQARSDGSGVPAGSQCTFNEVAGADFESFVIDGDFSKGGLDGLLMLTVYSKNDPIKAYFEEREEMYNDIRRKQELAREEIGWGDGYLSKKVCSIINDATGGAVQNCESVTPGALIRDTIAFHVGELPALKLVEADEINEIIGALAGNLSNFALQGTYGLLGLGGNDRYADNRFGAGENQSFADALKSDQNSVAVKLSTTEINSAITTNTEYRDLQQGIIDDVEELEDELEEGKTAHPSCFVLELSDELTTDKSDAETNLAVADQVLTLLEQIKTLASNGSITEQDVVYQQYLVLQGEGLVRTSYDVAKLKAEFIDLAFVNRVAAFEAEIEQEEKKCK